MIKKLKNLRKVKVDNNKKDFKSINRDLKGTEELFINNTQRMIYNFR